MIDMPRALLVVFLSLGALGFFPSFVSTGSAVLPGKTWLERRLDFSFSEAISAVLVGRGPPGWENI